MDRAGKYGTKEEQQKEARLAGFSLCVTLEDCDSENMNMRHKSPSFACRTPRTWNI